MAIEILLNMLKEWNAKVATHYVDNEPEQFSVPTKLTDERIRKITTDLSIDKLKIEIEL